MSAPRPSSPDGERWDRECVPLGARSPPPHRHPAALLKVAIPRSTSGWIPDRVSPLREAKLVDRMLTHPLVSPDPDEREQRPVHRGKAVRDLVEGARGEDL